MKQAVVQLLLAGLSECLAAMPISYVDVQMLVTGTQLVYWFAKRWHECVGACEGPFIATAWF